MSINSLEEFKELKAQGVCPDCKRDMKDARFKDHLSQQEFKISGLCQVCQDEIFNIEYIRKE